MGPEGIVKSRKILRGFIAFTPTESTQLEGVQEARAKYTLKLKQEWGEKKLNCGTVPKTPYVGVKSPAIRIYFTLSKSPPEFGDRECVSNELAWT
jgi:hypothetical protein